MNRFASFTLAAAGAVLCLPASAQFAKTEDAIKYRQSAMFIQSHHMGRLGAMASGRAPYDAAAAVANAEVVAEISQAALGRLRPRAPRAARPSRRSGRSRRSSRSSATS